MVQLDHVVVKSAAIGGLHVNKVQPNPLVLIEGPLAMDPPPKSFRILCHLTIIN
jgi:hypothetical protein